MATVEEKPSTEQEPSGARKGFYKTFRDTSEKISLSAMNMPLMFLEGAGVPEEKTQGLKNLNEKVVGGMYGASDWMVDKVGGFFTAPFRFVGNSVKKMRGRKAEAGEAAEPEQAVKAAAPKKAATKKAAPKKAAKKASVQKKAPPKVAARKPAPAKPEAKKAA